MNGLKTMGLMVSLTLLLVFVGAALGGKNGMTIALIFAFVMMIVGPIAGMLVQMAISRSREYGADAGGAKISGNPLYLANALNKLQNSFSEDSDACKSCNISYVHRESLDGRRHFKAVQHPSSYRGKNQTT